MTGERPSDLLQRESFQPLCRCRRTFSFLLQTSVVLVQGNACPHLRCTKRCRLQLWPTYGHVLPFCSLPRGIAVHDGMQYAVPFRITTPVHHLLETRTEDTGEDSTVQIAPMLMPKSVTEANNARLACRSLLSSALANEKLEKESTRFLEL